MFLKKKLLSISQFDKLLLSERERERERERGREREKEREREIEREREFSSRIVKLGSILRPSGGFLHHYRNAQTTPSWRLFTLRIIK